MLNLFSKILLIGFLLIPNTSFALDDAIIAIVNDEVVTLKDLREYMNKIYSQLRLEGKDPFEIDEIMSQYEEKGIQQLVEDRLILSRADKIGMEISGSPIDQRIDAIKDKYGSEQEFWKALKSEGITITDLRNKIADQMKAQYVVEREVKSKIFVNPEEVTRYYEENPLMFKREESVKLESIFLSFEQGKTVAKNKADEAKKDLNTGTDFQRVAAQYSDAPSVGVVEKGQLLDKVEAVVFNMKEGEISNPIEVDNGIFIFQLVKKISGDELPLDDVKEKIRNKIFQDKFKEEFRKWIEELREDAYVEIK